jgi:DnaJ-class molecular chaperone
MKFGDFLQPSEKAIKSRILKKGDIGLFIKKEDGDLIKVIKQGTITTDSYSKDFWCLKGKGKVCRKCNGTGEEVVKSDLGGYTKNCNLCNGIGRINLLTQKKDK